MFYGGAKGGGKSHLIRAREVIRRLKYPNSKGLIVRKTYPELLANHIRPFFKEYPQTQTWFNKSEKAIYWPNGSITEFSYLRNTDDVYTYQGREYEDMAVDEITQHEWEVVRILRSSLRTTLKDIMPTMLLTGNPGGIGHADVKRIFIDRKFNPDENPNDFDFVQAFIQDNKALMDADPDYVKRLENLPEHLKKAYLYGDWNIFAGLAFTELSEHVHLIPPFEITDPQTKYFAGYDYGFTHPYAFVLCAVTGDKTVYVTGVTSENNLRIDEQAKQIKKLVGDKKMIVYTGTDAWSNRGGPKIVDQLRNQLPNLSFVKAYTDPGSRVQGVAQLRKLFAHQGTKTGKPQLYFFKNTQNLFDQVRGMQYDERRPEDVLKVDADMYGYGGDDMFDAMRYAVTTHFRPNPKEEQNNTRHDSGQHLLDLIEDRARARRAQSWA